MDKKSFEELITKGYVTVTGLWGKDCTPEEYDELAKSYVTNTGVIEVDGEGHIVIIEPSIVLQNISDRLDSIEKQVNDIMDVLSTEVSAQDVEDMYDGTYPAE